MTKRMPARRKSTGVLVHPGAGGNGTHPQAGTLVQPEGKGEMMERRLAARIPVVLYTIHLEKR